MSVTCFFIGHRDAPESVYPRLIASIERHIIQYGVVSQYSNIYNQNHIGNTRNLIVCANRRVAKGLMAIENLASQ